MTPFVSSNIFSTTISCSRRKCRSAALCKPDRVKSVQIGHPAVAANSRNLETRNFMKRRRKNVNSILRPAQLLQYSATSLRSHSFVPEMVYRYAILPACRSSEMSLYMMVRYQSGGRLVSPGNPGRYAFSRQSRSIIYRPNAGMENLDRRAFPKAAAPPVWRGGLSSYRSGTW